MSRVKSILGTAWAAAALPLLLVMFFGLGKWPALLVGATGLHVTPRYTGGPTVSILARDGFTVHLHRPVFDGLVGKRSEGFVQVDVVATSGAQLPPIVEESLTPEGNPAMAFTLRLDTATRTATVRPVGAAVLGVAGVWQLDQGLAVRVALQNPR
jgi:hypothetical protein